MSFPVQRLQPLAQPPAGSAAVGHRHLLLNRRKLAKREADPPTRSKRSCEADPLRTVCTAYLVTRSSQRGDRGASKAGTCLLAAASISAHSACAQRVVCVGCGRGGLRTVSLCCCRPRRRAGNTVGRWAMVVRCGRPRFPVSPRIVLGHQRAAGIDLDEVPQGDVPHLLALLQAVAGCQHSWICTPLAGRSRPAAAPMVHQLGQCGARAIIAPWTHQLHPPWSYRMGGKGAGLCKRH